MGLTITSVTNATTPNEEFVWLKTTEKINLNGYAVVDRTFDPNDNISNEFRHIFIFPSIEIEKNDWVKLCTGTGKYKKVNNTAGGYNHYFYWQANSCVWNNNGGDKASLIKYNLVNSVSVSALKK